MCVGLQRDGFVFAADAHEDARGGKVDDRRGHRYPETDPDRLERLRIEQPLEGSIRDADCGKENEKALECTGEIFRLAVPVRMIIVGRLGSQRQHGKRHHRACQVDEGLERVGEQAD